MGIDLAPGVRGFNKRETTRVKETTQARELTVHRRDWSPTRRICPICCRLRKSRAEVLAEFFSFFLSYCLFFVYLPRGDGPLQTPRWAGLKLVSSYGGSEVGLTSHYRKVKLSSNLIVHS